MGLEEELGEDLKVLKTNQKIIEEKRKQYVKSLKDADMDKSGELLIELLTLCGKSLKLCNQVLNKKLIPDLKTKIGEKISEKAQKVDKETKDISRIIAIPKYPNIH